MSRDPFRNVTSYSELATLAQCEWKWAWRYLHGNDQQDESNALFLGSLMHNLCAKWWEKGSWGPYIEEAMEYEGASRSDEPFVSAAWLMYRYVEMFNLMREEKVKAIAHEFEVKAEIPGTGIDHVAIIDGLWETDDGLWIVERKTYGRRQRLDLVTVDPQLTLNLWAARESGIPAKGVVFDGIYTYRWKGDERPAYESFDQIWLDRTDAHIREALADVRSMLQRRDDLREYIRPTRNLNQNCGWCPARSACFESLAFPQETYFSDE